MEADWNEINRVSLSAPGFSLTPVTAFGFDPTENLLWTGDEHGRLTSYYGGDLQKYTSGRAHAPRDQRAKVFTAPVRQILFCDKGIITISNESIHLTCRHGRTRWHISTPDMENLRCMAFTNKSSTELVAAGCQKTMYRIDVMKGEIIETLTPQVSIAYTMMRQAGQCICAASHDGSIHALDSKTLKVTHTWKAYAGSVNDMDARGDHLLTCGWAPRHYQGLVLEQHVRVFDLKTHKPAPPISFPPGAAYVRMHPKLSSTCMVISQTGAIYSFDVQNPDVPTMRFAPTYDAQLQGLEMMPSGNGFAMIDSNCQLILWGSTTKRNFVEYGKPTDFADPVIASEHLDWTTDNLNLIGMPYYREMLLSVWSNSLIHEVGVPAANVADAMRKFQSGAVSGSIAPFPRTERRYEAHKSRSDRRSGHGKIAAPKFLSEKPRDDAEPELPRRLSEDVAKSLAELTMGGGLPSLAPAWYQVVEIKYSKFGVEDFDFGYYNETEFSGLETHIVNSYANPLLQLLRFIPVFRNLALQHTARDCVRPNCFTCELGFLFDMLEKAKGKSCQATNFLKVLSKHPNAAALAVLEGHNATMPLSMMIQNLNRFILNTVADELRVGGPVAEQSFGTTGLAFSRCGHCSYEASQQKVWYLQELVYPNKTYKPSPRQQRFSQILKSSVERYDQQRGWCSNCQGYKPIASRRIVEGVPAVLSINTAATTPEAKQMWSQPDFLPTELGVIVKDGQFFCYEGQDLRSHLQRRAFDIVVYELVGTVADINLGDSKKSHLVSLIDTDISDPVGSSANWHLFNDFLVRKDKDALHFDARWKIPSVAMYQVKTMSHKIDQTWQNHIDVTVLYRSVTQPKFAKSAEFGQLTVEEQPSSNTHSAIDSEFVRLLREEIDVGADGSRTITRPHRSGLARVSVLRGDEPQQGVAFIDDYISIDDPIDDYLTEFSGLHPGDLTNGRSPYILVNLKAVYKKLWVLLNLGVRFIGHGLKSDFRIINMHVPESQVIDTQELFSLGSRARRKLSLRFLAWHILKEDIQQNTVEGHDSIEDARTALKLWRKYLEYVDAGILENMIDEIWIRGKALDFKVPAERERNIRNSGGLSTCGSAPGTPAKTPASLAKFMTAHAEFGSPGRG